MELRFPESEIQIHANNYSDFENDKQLMSIEDEIKNQEYLLRSQLKKVVEWKSKRNLGLIDENDSGYVEEITKISFEAKHERTRIEVLTLLVGVSWATASVILHFFHEDPYPVLDFRALYSIQEEEPNSYDFSFWESYCEFCRKVANRNEVDMRTLDRALWQYSIDHQE